MNLLEHDAKNLILAPAGIPVASGMLCRDSDAAATAATALGRCVVKAQVPSGKRGKAGGIHMADTPDEARAAASAILGMIIAGYRTDAVLVEPRADIKREFYASVLHAPRERASLVLFAAEGGMDIEEIAETRPHLIARHLVTIPDRFGAAEALTMLDAFDIGAARQPIAEILVALYRRYRETDAELIEINPLAELADGRIVALDCKFVLDDAAAYRQAAIATAAVPDPMTELEAQAATLGLKFIELDGSVGILANGAGLTMTTMDVITHFGGRPANFLEIGGDAYTRAEEALGLLLGNPRMHALVVNFCGAFARTDVMARGVVEAWRRLQPDIPVFFSVHGTGEDEAVALIRAEFGAEPFDLMEDAVRAAIRTAR